MNTDLLYVATIVLLTGVGVYFAAKLAHLAEPDYGPPAVPTRAGIVPLSDDAADRLLADVFPDGLPLSLQRAVVYCVCGEPFCNDYEGCAVRTTHRHCHSCIEAALGREKGVGDMAQERPSELEYQERATETRCMWCGDTLVFQAGWRRHKTGGGIYEMYCPEPDCDWRASPRVSPTECPKCGSKRVRDDHGAQPDYAKDERR